DRLAHYRARGTPMPFAQVARHLNAIAAALDYAHARGAVHRDIKPANILFTARGEPVLGDFGVAKILGESLQLSTGGAVIGTPAYMSPEQAAGRPTHIRSDLYSLGVVLYEMVTGRVPFEGDSPTAVMLQHLSTPPPPPRQFNPNISEAMQAVILKALAKEPSARFQTGDELARAFDAAVRALTPATDVATQAPTLPAQAATPNIVSTGAPTVAPPKIQSAAPAPKSPATRPRGAIHPILVLMFVAVFGLGSAGAFIGLLFLSGFLRVNFSPAATATPTRAAAITPTAAPVVFVTPTVTSTRSSNPFGAIVFAPGIMGTDPNVKPVDPGTRFPEGISRICTLFTYEGPIKGNQWRFERYRDGQIQTDLGLDAGSDHAGSGTEWYCVWSSSGLSPGEWEFRLYYMDKLAQKGTYTIERTVPGAAAFGTIRFAEGIADGKPSNPHRPIDNFKSGTTQVYAFFDATNLSKQTNWKWQWYRDGNLLENLGGAEAWRGDSTEKDWWLRIYNDKGLTSGTYELKLYIDNKVAQLGTFVIEP
ncbi:MAG: protein kinase, partial [Chloroflexota bacterium]